MEKNSYEEIEIDIRELLYLLRTRIWIILLTGIISALAAGFVSNYMITPLYTSKAQLYVLSKTTSITSLADIQIGTQLTQDYMVLIKSRPVVNQVIENLDLNMSYENLKKMLTVTNPNNTRILEIEITYPNAYIAKKIVDEFAYVATEQIAKIMRTEAPSIVEEGYVPTIPSEPNVKRNIAIGGLLGILIAATVVIILYLMDDTVKDSDDVEKHLGLSTLGLIPMEAGTDNRSGKKFRLGGRKNINKRGKK